MVGPRWKRGAAAAVKFAAAAADVPRRLPRGVTILIYHRVGARSGLAVDLPAPLFRAQMDELASAGRATSLDAGLRLVANPSSGGTDPVVVTFDDGTADFVDLVVPELDRVTVPATLYVATEFVETGRSFPNGGRPVSWAGLQDALATGLVTIGSHTHSHALLDRLPAGQVDAELDRSIGLIEDRLGVTPIHFAYPKALLGSSVAQDSVRRRFQSAAVAGTRTNPYQGTDPYRLARSPVQVGDGMRWWRRKVSGGLTLEDSLRRFVSGRRYASATT